ncbi:MAG: hypothetical protein K6G88_04155, partial [Lachnospiraceae bacterium]|nr:hypothetical protein [Lachnospiraceae bacterium]
DNIKSSYEKNNGLPEEYKNEIFEKTLSFFPDESNNSFKEQCDLNVYHVEGQLNGEIEPEIVDNMKLKSISVENIVIHGNTASARAVANKQNSDSIYDVDLIKIHGKWYLDYLLIRI